MQDQFNPYAAPATVAMHPKAADWLRTQDPSLLKVGRGLGNIYLGIVLAILAVIGGAILAAIAGAAGAAAGGQQGAAGGLFIVVLIAGVAVLVGYIMIIVGTLQCLATPEETGARGMIVASVIMAVMAFVLGVGRAFMGQKAAAGEFGPNEILNAASNLLSLGSQITFLLFLKKLAEFIGAASLADRAKTLLILMGATFALGLVLGITLYVAAPLGILIGIALFAIAIVSFFMYLRLLRDMKLAILGGAAS
jgi:hypothetical protein